MVELLRDLEWTRPAALAALVLPLAVWLLARRRGRPRPVPVGTFALWQDAPRGAPGARRRRVPPSTWLLIAALVLGALALGGPRRRPAASPAAWRVVVDRSPSMYLPRETSGSPSPTRLEDALGRLARLAGERGAQVVEWLAPASPAATGAAPEGEETARGSAPPEAWRAPPRAPLAAPRWSRHDAPNTVWLTDRAPIPEPLAAGVVACGGPAVPGPVAARGTLLVEWDGHALVERPGAAPAPVLALDETVPAVLADLVRAWAAERGVLMGDGAGPQPVLLDVRAPMDPAGAVAVAFGRDGWSSAGRARPLAPDGGGGAVWLVGEPGGLPLVRHSPGRLDLGLVELEEPIGDPALFAVSWSALLDASVLAPPGVVALPERRAAGPSLVRAPRAAAARAVEERFPLAARLAGLASFCALLALGAAAWRRG